MYVETAMGVNINSQQNKNKEYVHAVHGICNVISGRLFSWKSIDFLFKFSADYKKQDEYVKVLYNFTDSVIKEKVTESRTESVDELGRKRKMALLDGLMNASIDGRPLSNEEIKEEVSTFMFAVSKKREF